MSDINQSTSNTAEMNTTDSSGGEDSALNKVKELLKKKWVMGTMGVLIVGGIVFFLLFRQEPASEPVVQPDSGKPTITVPGQLSLSPAPTFTAGQLEQIEEQRKADAEVGKREIEIKTKYPWFDKLPLRGEKYFVYFKRDGEVFIGGIYPKPGDDVEQLKAEAVTKLKDIYGIPVENYSFEWQVTNN